ncbi:twin-arginine translocation signal domain-containing protein [Dietzia aerolata]|uniref:twin-arginine translocation signal domain-containing protein n=1 Tax=Dietzia aerolata TaxID=595984 RepID=UPI003636F861
MGPVGLGDDHCAPGVRLSGAYPDRGRAGSLYRLGASRCALAGCRGAILLPVTLSRRRFLAASAGVMGAVAVTGCTGEEGDGVSDPVVELIRAAERDAREFAAADTSHGKYVDALRLIADVRRIHAERLAELVETPPESTAATTTTAEPDSVVTCPPVGDVRARLRTDSGHASEVALESEGIRAELTGSVSAACITAVEVLLA